MLRTAAGCLAALILAASAGCCASPMRFYQNAYGFNNPQIEHYRPGDPPPVTTPPGYEVPAVIPPPKADTEAKF